MVAGVGDHQIVEDAAGIIGEQRVTLVIDAEVDDVDRDEALQGGRGVIPDEPDPSHVGDVEQAGGGTGVVVLLHNAGRVLHRHLVAGESHHLAAELEMQGVHGVRANDLSADALLSLMRILRRIDTWARGGPAELSQPFARRTGSFQPSGLADRAARTPAVHRHHSTHGTLLVRSSLSRTLTALPARASFT